MSHRASALGPGLTTALLALVLAPSIGAQQYDPAAFSEMRWRAIGPFRGGRTKAITGVRQQPATFYVGVCNGGVWKTTDAGHTWKPIFDDQPTGSIGSIAVAPSDPDVVYVGSGEGLQRPDLSTGDGIYKSTDAGRTWTHLGLRDGQQIPNIAVDPRDPERLFVAVLGHPYGPNEERGVFRSTDGGRTFDNVLYVDEDTGGNDVDIDPTDSRTVYATLWEARQGPWENAAWSGTGGGIFKSTDGGTTWRKLTLGLPTAEEGGVVQVNMAIAPSDPRRIYATVASQSVGIFRSDDAGESWMRITDDRRPAGRIGGGDLPVPFVHPQDPDHVIIASTVSWRSVDGGRTWRALKGAPGGDDYQNGWINPDHPEIIAMAADQGAVVSLNDGETWSSWYNQPTAQLYHVAADNAFPYRVYSGQQESGSVGIASRGNDGQITFREWHPVGVDEYGYVAPDPLDPDLIFGGRSVSRWDRRTGQVSRVGPVGRGGGFRQVRTQPVVFSTVDPHVLFFANSVLWKTRDGGTSWQQISPDVTREAWNPPSSIGKYLTLEGVESSRRGVIYTIAPSYVDVDRIWLGTDDGLVHTTADGGRTWTDVTPPALGPWMKVSILDAGRFDAETAYAAVNTIRLDDMRPHIYRTHDGGRTWTEIVAGLPENAPVNAVREDPQRRGLLFAGTEREVHVSFDDGDHWHPLRLNMAASSVRDLIVKDDDLVAATHGRGFWILDDITPLRQLSGSPPDDIAVLFAPQEAYRVRWNMNTDTPLPPEEPTGPNPPEGAIINYYLGRAASQPITLEMFHEDGRPVRSFSSDDPITLPDPATAPVPLYWYRPPQALSTEPGMHRFTWDLHYQPLAGGGAGGRGGLPIAAVPHDTTPSPSTPWVAPGSYTVKLTVDGITHTRQLTVALDPRVTTPATALREIFSLTESVYYTAVDAQAAMRQAADLRRQIAALQQRGVSAASAAALAAFDDRLEAVSGSSGGGAGRAGGRGRGARGRRGGRGGAPAGNTLAAASSAVGGVMNSLQSADVAPTDAAREAIAEALQLNARVMAIWGPVKSDELGAVNSRLTAEGLPPLTLR